jgi:hypothetical protein
MTNELKSKLRDITAVSSGAGAKTEEGAVAMCSVVVGSAIQS